LFSTHGQGRRPDTSSFANFVFPSILSVCTKLAECLLDLFQILNASILHLLHQPQIFLLQLVEILVELVVPRIKDEDLEGECGRGDQEVCDGETAGDYHLVSCGAG